MSEYGSALARLEEMEARYREALARLGRAEAGIEALEDFFEAMRPLMEAYEATWLSDREAVEEGPQPRLAVLGEDAVWDLCSDQHRLAQRMLRLAARHFSPSED